MASVTALWQPTLTPYQKVILSCRGSHHAPASATHRRRPQLACRASLPTAPAGQPTDSSSSQVPSLDQEWVNLGLSYLAEEEEPEVDEERLRLGLAFSSSETSVLSSTPLSLERSSCVIDRVWLDLGLSLAETESAFVLEEPTILDEEPEGVAVAEAPVAADPSTYFATDLRPIVLFDGACNFCSKWVVFLLDHDPHGNLRFASMQGEAGKVLLRRAGLKETDTSEIVLATHNKSLIGADAILQIFSRLSMPFPLIAAVGMVTPGPVSHRVYKFVSKYRHKFGGPSACRLFDTRFNERFVS